MKEYSISYSSEREQWEVWQVTKLNGGIDIRCIFEGTKKECEKYLNSIKK